MRLDTPEPIKVDVSMKVDVYQHALPEPAQRKLGEDESSALRRRDERSGQIWGMKNDSVVVEGEKGYLEIRGKSGWDPEYVKKLVTEENNDRRILYEGEARESSRHISAIEEEAGKRLREQAYGRGQTSP